MAVGTKREITGAFACNSEEAEGKATPPKGELHRRVSPSVIKSASLRRL